MKHFFVLLYAAAFSLPLYAKTINLDLENYSRDTITVVKHNGEEVVLDGFQDVKQVAFELPSIAKAYKNGRYICRWIITSEKFFALAYGIPQDERCAILTY